MPPSAFQEQLEFLSAEHEKLEEENRTLRTALKDCQFNHKDNADSILSVVQPPRYFCQDVMHSMAPTHGHITVVPAPLAELPQVIGSRQSTSSHSSCLALVVPTGRRPSHVSVTATESDSTSDDAPSLADPSSSYEESITQANQPIRASFMDRLSVVSGESFAMQSTTFFTKEAIKQKVRQALVKQTAVRQPTTHYYKSNGLCQAIARNPVFEFCTLGVIALNMVWIGVDTDYNKENILTNALPVFQVAEHSFCFYFTVDIIIRICSFESKRLCFEDAWLVFDISLVLLMVLETWVANLCLWLAFPNAGARLASDPGSASVLTILQILRLARVARVVRLVRAIPELLILIKGIAAAARSVFFTLLLLLTLLFVFGIVFTQLLENQAVGKRHFHSVAKSMHTLWLYAALVDEITHLMKELESAGVGVMLLMDSFILVSTLMVMNMIVGVLCQVVSKVANSEREESSLRLVKTKLQRIFHELGLGETTDGQISREQFQAIIENQDAARAMHDLGVDVVQMVDMADSIFASAEECGKYRKELSFVELMDAVLQLRGSNFATVKDVVNLRHVLSKQLQTSQEKTSNAIKHMSASPPDSGIGYCATGSARLSRRPSTIGLPLTISKGHM